MAAEKRVNMRKELYVKLALGRSKSGYSIEDNTTFHNYIGLDGDTIEYLQEYETHSPLKTKLGAALREGTWQNPRKIAELIQFMYTNDSCKLYYVLTKEHACTFF